MVTKVCTTVISCIKVLSGNPRWIGNQQWISIKTSNTFRSLLSSTIKFKNGRTVYSTNLANVDKIYVGKKIHVCRWELKNEQTAWDNILEKRIRE